MLKKLTLVIIGLIMIGGTLIIGACCPNNLGDSGGNIGKTPDNLVPLGTPLALPAVSQELTVLGMNEEIVLGVRVITVTVKIKAIGPAQISTTGLGDFDLVGSRGIIYTSNWFPTTGILAGASITKDITFSFVNRDDSDFLLIWRALQYSGGSRFFALH